ncbi:hypothetical protein VNO80_20007 [Phaseolus coccineus]|uniref:Thiamine pyrophosphate enzyme TPP-binding domain-containing protein n=1 Tax=Phaseolus coccineus TaxID=3886 RepID=A0AAN9R0C7_PHACN
MRLREVGGSVLQGQGHTYLGDPSGENEIFPNMLKFADACGIPAIRVRKKEELKAAIQKMLDTPGPYLLEVIVPHQEHVLPMIPSNGSLEDVITEGDGRTRVGPMEAWFLGAEAVMDEDDFKQDISVVNKCLSLHELRVSATLKVTSVGVTLASYASATCSTGETSVYDDWKQNLQGLLNGAEDGFDSRFLDQIGGVGQMLVNFDAVLMPSVPLVFCAEEVCELVACRAI